MVQTRSVEKHEREETPARSSPENKRRRQDAGSRSRTASPKASRSPKAKSVKKDADASSSTRDTDSEADLKPDLKPDVKQEHSLQDLQINDVCRSEAAWREFRSSAKKWKSIGLGIASEKHRDTEDVLGVALCEVGSDPVWIPLADEQFYGTEDESKTRSRSSSPSDKISHKDRATVVSSILSNCHEVFVFDAMSVCSVLRKSFPHMFIQNPIDVSYLAFLGLMRQGDHPLPLPALLRKCHYTTDTKEYLRGSARVSAAATAFVLPSIYSQIRPNAVKQSSERSVALELNAMGVAVRIMVHGVLFDVKLCRQKEKALRERMDQISEECRKFAGRYVDLNSSRDVAKVLFTHLKLPYPGNVNTQSRSTSKDTLQRITEHHPMPQLVIDFRRINFSLSHHILPLRDSLHLPADTLHPYLDLFTATGRLVSSNPNIQNVTNEELIPGFGVRHLFVVREGYALVSADYAQLELRVMAHLSGDPKLIALFRERNRDIFSEMSKELGYERASVKTLCYGIIYGIGTRSLGQLLNCTQKEASNLISSFFHTYPKVQTYIADVKEKYKEEKYVKTGLGRKRLRASTGEHKERLRDNRQSVNYTIQGTASEIFKLALVEVERRLKEIGGYIVLPMHDELVCEVPEKHAKKANSILKECMEGAYPELEVPLYVKTDTGKCWADLDK